MKKKIKYILIVSFVVMLLSITCFLLGFYSGRHVAQLSIKSELVWYNQFLLKQSIEDMKQGNISEAEKKISYVNDELEKMKDFNNKTDISNPASPGGRP
jgi:hypothetical protein